MNGELANGSLNGNLNHLKNGLNGSLKVKNGGNGVISNGINGKSNGIHTIVEKRVQNDKVFIGRESLITDLLEIKEFKAIYNITLAVLFNMILYHSIYEYLTEGRIDLGFSNFFWLFANPGKWLGILSILHLFPIVLIYPSLKYWADNRPIAEKSRKIWDHIFASGLVFYIMMYIYIPWGAIRSPSPPLNPGAGAIIVLEQIRIAMKIYAFLWTQIRRIRNEPLSRIQGLSRHNSNGISNDLKLNQDVVVENSDCDKISKFSKFLYYLYAPTLVYSDSYPRTDKIRWGFVFWNFATTLACVWFYSFIQSKYGYFYFKNFGHKENPMTGLDVLNGVFGYFVSGGISYFLGFFVLLHTWQNFFAEILRFADRSFYKDWWNSTSFAEYYRKQNSIVQDFLYIYIYKELKKTLGPSHKYLPGIFLLIISAIVHEYIFIYALQYFLPALLLFFGGPGLILAFFDNKKYPMLGNIFINWSLITGCALIHSAYNIEYYARVNGCPGLENPLADFFYPRSIFCLSQFNQ